MSAQLFPSAESHIIDANLFIRFERHDTVDLLERAATEQYARVYNEVYGLPTVSLRYFTVYGPRMRPNVTSSPS